MSDFTDSMRSICAPSTAGDAAMSSAAIALAMAAAVSGRPASAVTDSRAVS